MRSTGGDRGQASIQFAGAFPIVLVVILLCAKIYIAMVTVEQVNNAARTGARVASKNHDPSRCPTEALAALPDWIKNGSDDGVGATATPAGSGVGVISCRVQAKLPVIWQGVPLNFTVDRTVYMPG